MKRRFRLNPKAPPKLSPEAQARLAAMTDAAADPDNPPLTEAELERLKQRRWR